MQNEYPVVLLSLLILALTILRIEILKISDFKNFNSRNLSIVNSHQLSFSFKLDSNSVNVV